MSKHCNFRKPKKELGVLVHKLEIKPLSFVILTNVCTYMPTYKHSKHSCYMRERRFLQLEVFDFRDQIFGCPLDGLLELLLLLRIELRGQRLDILLDVSNELFLVKRRLLL